MRLFISKTVPQISIFSRRPTTSYTSMVLYIHLHDIYIPNHRRASHVTQKSAGWLTVYTWTDLRSFKMKYISHRSYFMFLLDTLAIPKRRWNVQDYTANIFWTCTIISNSNTMNEVFWFLFRVLASCAAWCASRRSKSVTRESKASPWFKTFVDPSADRDVQLNQGEISTFIS